jgi:hypothetical protein
VLFFHRLRLTLAVLEHIVGADVSSCFILLSLIGLPLCRSISISPVLVISATCRIIRQAFIHQSVNYHCHINNAPVILELLLWKW